MRKFTSDYIYGVIDTYISVCDIKPINDYAFNVSVYEDYAVIKFAFDFDAEEAQEWQFRFIKREPLVKLCKNVQDTLEIIYKYETKNN